MVKAKKKRITVKARKIVKKKTLRQAQGKPAKSRKVLVAKKKKAVKKIVKKTVKIKKKIKSLRHGSGQVKKPAKKVVKKKIKLVKILKIKKKVINARKKAKKVLAVPQTEFAAEALFKAKIKVIGIGGGGGSIVSEIGRSLQKATFVIADTDIRALKKRPGIKYLWFGEELTHGLGTGVNVDLAIQAAESAKEKISDIFKDQDIIIFVASLGGGLGSGATQIFADVAKEFGGITVGIFTLPFKFEGKNKYRIAQNALKALRKSLNVSIVIPNEKIFKIIDANTPITNAFSTVNKSLIESLESLIDLIYNPGVINIDFADLRTILKGVGNSAFLNTVEESGKDRVEKICEKVFDNPLLQNSGFEAEKILFDIAGAENLSMFEVEKISRHIADKNPKAKIIFGISKDSKLKNKIKTTILMTGGGVKERAIKEEIKVVEKIIDKEINKPEKKEVVAVEKQPEIKKPEKPKKVKPPKAKKPKIKKPIKAEKPVSFIPVFQNPIPAVPVADQKRLNIVETIPVESKKAIRRSGLEIKKAEELEEKKRQDQEKEWEIPAFLRKVKFKS